MLELCLKALSQPIFARMINALGYDPLNRIKLDEEVIMADAKD